MEFGYFGTRYASNLPSLRHTYDVYLVNGAD
jgi:hypothetical protein